MAIQLDNEELLASLNALSEIIIAWHIAWHNDTLFADLNQTDDGERADANVLPTVLFGFLSFMLMLALVGVLDYLVCGWLRSGWRPGHSQVRPARHG